LLIFLLFAFYETISGDETVASYLTNHSMHWVSRCW